MAPSVRAKVGISPSVPAPTLQRGRRTLAADQVQSRSSRRASCGAPFVGLQTYAPRVPRSAIQYLLFLPLIASILVGVGLITGRSWLFSIGFGLLLASVALVITLRRQDPP